MSDRSRHQLQLNAAAPEGRPILARGSWRFRSMKTRDQFLAEFERALATAGIDADEQARDRRRNNRAPADVEAAFLDEE